MDIVGYFNWRLGDKGQLIANKILKDRHTMAMNSFNHQEAEAYRRNLLKEIPLGGADWELGLFQLSQKYPAPERL